MLPRASPWARGLCPVGANDKDKTTASESLLAQIRDPAVRKIAARPMIGSLDQLSDSTDLLDNPSLRVSLRRLHE